MKFATIHLVDVNYMGNFYFTKDAVALAREVLQKGGYIAQTPIACYDWESGEAVAEEMFDLTNNPYRQSERVIKCGRGRSVSVGDIVETEGVLYVCRPNGWEAFTL